MSSKEPVTREEMNQELNKFARDTQEYIDGGFRALDSTFAKHVAAVNENNERTGAAIQQLQLHAKKTDADINRQKEETKELKNLVSTVKGAIHDMEKSLLTQRIWFLLTGISFAFGTIGIISSLVVRSLS